MKYVVQVFRPTSNGVGRQKMKDVEANDIAQAIELSGLLSGRHLDDVVYCSDREYNFISVPQNSKLTPYVNNSLQLPTPRHLTLT